MSQSCGSAELTWSACVTAPLASVVANRSLCEPVLCCDCRVIAGVTITQVVHTQSVSDT